MAIKTAYISKQGRGYKVSSHFTLGEIASKDGADKVLYSEELLAKLEELRAKLGGDARNVKINVNSFYRTAAYNAKIGGASLSKHISGLAADVNITKEGEQLPARVLCALCQTLKFDGVAFISDRSLHLDMGGRIYRGDERKGYGGNVGNDFYAYFDVTKAQVEDLLEEEQEPEKEEQEENDMTKEETKSIVYEVIAEMMTAKAQELPADWSKEARDWAKSSELMQGTNIGDEWESPLTREQFAEVMHRFAKLIDPIK